MCPRVAFQVDHVSLSVGGEESRNRTEDERAPWPLADTTLPWLSAASCMGTTCQAQQKA